MDRLLSLAGITFALAAGGAALGAGLNAGARGAPALLLAAGGALLGYAIAATLRSVALLLEQTSATRDPGSRRLEQLERERDILLRSIKDIELDAAMSKLTEEEATQLTDPLRQRTRETLRELDALQQGARPSVAEQVELEVRRRLGGSRQPARPAEEVGGD